MQRGDADVKMPYRLAVCAHKSVEVSAVCLFLMVQGNVLALTGTHFLTAGKTGLVAVLPTLAVAFTRYAGRLVTDRWRSSLFLGACGFVADVLVHPSHYPGAYTEAALTGVATTAASILVSYTPLGRRIERLADAFAHA